MLQERGLVINGFGLPYNPKLIARANKLRKNMTPMERKPRLEFLKGFPLNVMPQKVIDNYIEDFYSLSTISRYSKYSYFCPFSAEESN